MALLFVILVIILLWGIYAPLADLLFHVRHIGTIYRGSELRSEITLTFDDGPDPVYTPALLTLLDQYKVRAMFFLVGRTLEKYPDLVRQIHERGHVIGVHTDRHVNAWFTSPWRMRNEVLRTRDMLQRITGDAPKYFRPPWGRFNIFLLRQLRKLGMVPVLWTYACQDWEPGDRSKSIAQKIMAQAQNGAIVLLHDSGGAPGSPKNTLNALKVAIPRLQQIGFTLGLTPVLEAQAAANKRKVKVSRLSQKLLRPIWKVWDDLYSKIECVFPMTRIFRLNVGNWHFGPRYTKDTQANQAHGSVIVRGDSTASVQGQVAATAEPIIRDGDPFVEMHMQLIALQELIAIPSPEKMAVRGLREVRDSLHGIARALIYDDRYRMAQGIFGYTLMHRGIERLGFHVEQIPPTLNNRWISFLTKSIMVLHHPLGKKRLKSGLEDMELRLVWMTRGELLAKYFDGEVPTTVPSISQLLDLYPLVKDATQRS